MLGVTRYERITAFLLASCLVFGGTTAVLGVLWASLHASSTSQPVRVVPDILTLEEFGGGERAGVLEGDVNAPGPEADAVSSRDLEPVGEPVALQAAIVEVAQQAGAATDLADQWLEPGDSAGGRTGTNRAPRLGTQQGRFGGSPPSQRWEIVFEAGASDSEYARQLEFLQIELGVVVDGQLYRCAHLASPRPAVRVTEPRADGDEVVFIWRDERRRQADLRLVRHASERLVAENAVVLHFCPPGTVRKLQRLEREYAVAQGRADLRAVAKTRFRVTRGPAGHDIEITTQRYFAKYEARKP
jgi:hypothetical protein